MLEAIRRLWAHVVWADLRLLDALESGASVPAEAAREYAHILGADAVWLGRLQGVPPTLPVWPELERAALRGQVQALHAAYDGFLGGLDAEALARPVAYTTTDGRPFTDAAGDILLQVVLHAQYHRGRINLLLRQSGLRPAPADYIAFVRGAPAATSGDPRRARD